MTLTQKMKVKQGDLVQILSGKDRGKQGKVLQALPRERRVIVENLNIVKRHTKPRPIRDSSRMGGQTVQPGGVIDKPAPVNISNVMIVCKECNKATRTRLRVRQDGIKVRVCKRCGADVD